jgi:AraC-like DNA-binding protein
MNKNYLLEEYKTETVFDAKSQLRSHFGFHHLNAEQSAFGYLDREYRFGDFKLLEIEITGSIEVKHYTNQNKFNFDFPIEGAFIIESKEHNVEVGSDSVFITSSNTTPHFSIPEGMRGLSLQISHADLNAALTGITSSIPEKELCFPMIIDDQCVVKCVKDTLFGIMQTLKTLKNPVLCGLYSKQADQYLKTLLLTLFVNSAHKLIKTVELSQLSKTLQCAITYMLDNIGEKITLSDLERVTLVSAKRLTYQFKKYTHNTPMSYLLELRLRRLREELLLAGPNTKIVEIAIPLGLTHLGRMSSEYKKRFGELPSETLLLSKN